jgi:hypothetical protein
VAAVVAVAATEGSPVPMVGIAGLPAVALAKAGAVVCFSENEAFISNFSWIVYKFKFRQDDKIYRIFLRKRTQIL